MKGCFRICRYIVCVLLITFLLVSASAEQVVRFDLSNLDNTENAIVLNGNRYIFTDRHSSFAEAFPLQTEKLDSIYNLTVPEANINGFDEPEDRYLGLLSINLPANTEMELYVCVGDRNTGVYTVGDCISVKSNYMENIHATFDANDVLQIIDRIYLYSFEENGKRIYEATGLYVDFENYEATLLESVIAANLTADSLPTPEPIEVTAEPTEVPATATPEPTEVPATATPEPTEVPATATPEPTEVPATATPEPTETPMPVAAAATEPPKDTLALEEIDIAAEKVDVNGEIEQTSAEEVQTAFQRYFPWLLAMLVCLLLFIILLLRRNGKKTTDDTSRRRRFFRLMEIDKAMRHHKPAAYADIASLDDLCRRFRDFAASRLHLYYSLDMIRCFIASFAASRLIIMQGISGTGKTSLAYAFGKFVENDASIIPVQPSWRERSDLLGYFNEFTKRFNETELLEKIYEAQYNQDVYISVLDEMNIARVEYYFAEFLSILEMPNPDEWIVSIVPDHWLQDPAKLDNGRLRLPRNMWFVGTANNDDSTFAISDKVYDRAMVLDIDSKAEPFEAPDTNALHISSTRFETLLSEAKRQYFILDENIAKIRLLDQYLTKHLRVAFGNRIMNQFYNFVPAYMACGGTELCGIDYILCKKVLRKLESQNLAYIRDAVDDLCDYLDEQFGVGTMKNSIDYLKRLKKMS